MVSKANVFASAGMRAQAGMPKDTGIVWSKNQGVESGHYRSTVAASLDWGNIPFLPNLAAKLSDYGGVWALAPCSRLAPAEQDELSTVAGR